MSSVLRPRGPQAASVYWRRRAVVLIVVVALPVVLALLLFGGGDDQSQAGAAPQAEPTGAADATPTPSGEPSAQPSGSASPSASAKASVPQCPESAIAVAVAADKEIYAAGENPQITMTISNTSDADCLRDIGSGANTVKVTSGGYDVWSSDDCDPSQASNEQVLPAGGEAKASVTWERKVSAPGCAGEATDAQPGVYQAEASNGDVGSEQVRFTIQ